jgi:hypothetical protein
MQIVAYLGIEVRDYNERVELLFQSNEECMAFCRPMRKLLKFMAKIPFPELTIKKMLIKAETHSNFAFD